MTQEEIFQLGRTLAVRRKKSQLWKQLKIERPTLSWDTIIRAFKNPNDDSILFEWIYQEGAKLIEEDNARIELAKKDATATFHNTEAHN